MGTKTVRLTGDLLKGVPYRTMAEDVDESATIRQLIRLGVEWCAVKLYKIRKITLHDCGVVKCYDEAADKGAGLRQESMINSRGGE